MRDLLDDERPDYEKWIAFFKQQAKRFGGRADSIQFAFRLTLVLFCVLSLNVPSSRREKDKTVTTLTFS